MNDVWILRGALARGDTAMWWCDVQHPSNI